MTAEKTLPPVNPLEATRYVASKLGSHALYNQKGHRDVDFTRPSASTEREYIAALSLSKVGEAALFQFSLDDTYAHIDTLS